MVRLGNFQNRFREYEENSLKVRGKAPGRPASWNRVFECYRIL
jgi:hypothetical protein